ncbi:MAG: DUF1549 and DUF1553 domain-containing protein, partial [Planctomycetota bacterium]
PDDSVLMHSIRREYNDMPPKENDRLSEKEIGWVEQWIRDGAVWPSETVQDRFLREARTAVETDEGVLVQTSGGTSDQWTFRRYQPEDLWAFEPIAETRRQDLPIEANQSPIDFFIDAKIKQQAWQPAPEANPRELAIRSSMDLLGLRPSDDQIRQFESRYRDQPAVAWASWIDELLASPHYGERQAQHWLDVTRYADTGGMSNDYERSNMWRYRDYVVRAFNADKPYDAFVREQLAGDEMADRMVAQRLSERPDAVVETQMSGEYTVDEAEKIVATGYLRLGPWDNAMIDKEEARQIYLDDIVNNVGQTFLSTTMRCVKCHDHKFDPIPTRDYYRMYAAFATTHMAERRVPHLPAENLDGFEAGQAHVEKMLDFAIRERDKLVAIREQAAREWFESRDLEYRNNEARKSLPDDKKPPRNIGLNHVQEGRLKVREQDVWIWRRRLERYQPMAQSVFNAGASKLAWNGARKLRVDPKADRMTAPENFILTGGALDAQGDPVGPGVLSATRIPVDGNVGDAYRLPDDVTGRRTALAKWITHPEHPLTSRSYVNRIWQSHFGTGLAKNTNNFGGKGAKPTHPELLDFLARDFVENGWRIKRMHRMIMLSDAYRRSTRHPDPASIATEDPDNRLLTFFPRRRLTSEEIRDAMLVASGELNPSTGGLPAMPEINMEVALQPRMIQFSLAPAYQPSKTALQRNRRSLYAYRVRGMADPLLEIFNQPNPNESCELRDAAAVTPQVFTLLNSEFVGDRSIAIAAAISQSPQEKAEPIDALFRRILQREPSPRERERLERYRSDMVDYHRATPVPKSTYPTEITRSLVEEFSGKPFEYREILPRFEAYEPDLKAWQVDAEIRALADVAILLWNTNEWMYVP